MFQKYQGNDKKQNIIESFMRLASNNSNLGEISVKMIADEAGIGKGTVYEYFKSKDDIIREAVSIIINAMFDWYLVDEYDGLSYEESLRQYIENCYKASMKIGEYSKYNSFTIRETFKYVDSKEFLHSKIRSLVNQVIKIFTETILPKGITEGIVDPKYDRVEAEIIAKMIIRDITENAEFKILDGDLLKEKLYSIAYKQMKKER